MADDKKSFSGITRDLTMVSIGIGIGTLGTLGFGYATDSIRSPEEREAFQKAAAAAAAKKG